MKTRSIHCSEYIIFFKQYVNLLAAPYSPCLGWITVQNNTSKIFSKKIIRGKPLQIIIELSFLLLEKRQRKKGVYPMFKEIFFLEITEIFFRNHREVSPKRFSVFVDCVLNIGDVSMTRVNFSGEHKLVYCQCHQFSLDLKKSTSCINISDQSYLFKCNDS